MIDSVDEYTVESHLRPTLSVQTVYFHKADQPAASQLGRELYQLLTRPAQDPLGFGPGIPVLCGLAADRVDLQAATFPVLVPVLGQQAFNLRRKEILSAIAEWQDQLDPGSVLPLLVDGVWRNVESEFPGNVMWHDSGDNWRQPLDEILLATTQLMESDDASRTIFISYAEADSVSANESNSQLAKKLATQIKSDAFFGNSVLLTGQTLESKIDNTREAGVFISVRGDDYSSQNWCQRELLSAKRRGFPTITIETLRDGEQRSSPYGGNSPTIVWNDNAADVVTRAKVEWLRVAHFEEEAARLSELADLPDDARVLARPPELLDLAQGRLAPGQSQLVVYPDPELSVFERQVLRSANPGLELTTPSTVWRKVLARDTGPELDVPLEGVQVAMSLSLSPDVDGPAGFTNAHVQDATVSIARALISVGAEIAYGGDFRRNPENYTTLLAELVGRYNNTVSSYKEFLHSYIAAPINIDDAPANVPFTLHDIHGESPDPEALLPARSGIAGHAPALWYSDMRRVMASKTDARIALGGQSRPRLEDDGSGYGGRFPGVVEEAWRTLEAGKPLYVVGGFGGASAMVADLLDPDAKPDPIELTDAHWANEDYFQATIKTIDNDPFSEKLGLPGTMDELASAIRTLGAPCLKSDEQSVAWNGLTVEENQLLFRSQDGLAITSLILKGLIEKKQVATEGKLNIELANGNIAAAPNLDGLSVAVFDDVPLSGAGAAINELASGKVALLHDQRKSIVSLTDAGISANWLHLASLGNLAGMDDLSARIEDAARETAKSAQRYGLKRLGVVAWGGAVISDMQVVVNAMVKGFEKVAGYSTLVWYELDSKKFKSIQEILENHPDVELSIRPVTKTAVATRQRDPQLFLDVRLQNDRLEITALPPAGTGIAFSYSCELTDANLEHLERGGGRGAPNYKSSLERGAVVAEWLFGEKANELFRACPTARVLVVHDVASSRIPFEILLPGELVAAGADDEKQTAAVVNAQPPSTAGGMSRRLKVAGAPIDQLFVRPPAAGKLKVLLIVNPTGDLAGAVKEGDTVRGILEQNDKIDLTVLFEEEATVEAVKNHLGEADVLHYAGHAFFTEAGETGSGLILHGKNRLTLADLRDCEMPRIAIVNACESGRVRGSEITTNAASFAELFLRSGVEAYIGTYWIVGDDGASQFAKHLYSELATGATLHHAVTSGRKVLLDREIKDWGNYILYGDGDFRLVND